MSGSFVTPFGFSAPPTVNLPGLMFVVPANAPPDEYLFLPLGLADQVLTVNPSATNASWQTPVTVTLNPNLLNSANESLVTGQPNIGTFTGEITATLPVTASVGQLITVTSQSASTLKIAQNANQQIRAPGNNVTTIGVAGSITMNGPGASIQLMCVVQDTYFNVLSMTDAAIVV